MESAIELEDVQCSEQVFDIAFHPLLDRVVACGLIDGKVEIWGCGNPSDIDSSRLLFCHQLHTSSCRGVYFNGSGDVLYTISSDKSLQGVNETGQLVFRIPNAHNKPINKFVSTAEHAIVTGDDAGTVKFWDSRLGSGAAMEWRLHEDFISGLAFGNQAFSLFSTGGDARLCGYDLRSQHLLYRSTPQESELHCLTIFPDLPNGIAGSGSGAVIAGAQDGSLLSFNCEESSGDDTGMPISDNFSSRFPLQSEAIDCMHKLDNANLLTGSSDGQIRLIALQQPDRVIGVIGDHEEFPVEGMCANRDNTLLGSFAHDEVVRFWDLERIASHTVTNKAADENGGWSHAAAMVM